MPEPIGSVYLDQPRARGAHPPAKRGARTAIAAQLALIGLLGLTIGGFLVLVRAAFGGPEPMVDAVQAALDDPDARDKIQIEVETTIEEQLLGPELIELAEIYEIDHEAEIAEWAAAVLEDPEFGDAVADLTSDVHRRVFVAGGSATVDFGPLSEIVVAHAHETAPALAPLLPPGRDIATFDSSALPDLSGPMGALDRAITIALMSAFALPLALVVHTRRHRVVAWTGQWLFAIALVVGVGAIGLPVLAGQMTGSVIVETAVRPEAIRLLAPAGLIGAIGVGMATFAAVWNRREKRKVAQEGAAAWLEVVEPPPAALPASAELEMARRGLVDGSRHLTNI